VCAVTKSQGRKLVKRRLQRSSPVGKALGLTGSAGYIREGRSAGRRGDGTGPAAEVEGSGRDNVVAGASGLVPLSSGETGLDALENIQRGECH
jgi:hypothetical protein